MQAYDLQNVQRNELYAFSPDLRNQACNVERDARENERESESCRDIIMKDR
jgi:hypothetical protein